MFVLFIEDETNKIWNYTLKLIIACLNIILKINITPVVAETTIKSKHQLLITKW